MPTPFEIITAAEQNGLSAGAVNSAFQMASFFGAPGIGGSKAFVKRFTKYFGGYHQKEQQPRGPFDIPVFESHAPHNGTVHVVRSTSSQKSRNGDLSIFGSTLFRSGIKVAIEEQDDAGEVDYCTINYLQVEATPVRYLTMDGARDIPGPWELEGIVKTADKPVPLNPCPYCTVSPSSLDRKKFKVNTALNYKVLPNPQFKRKTYTLTKGKTFAVPIPFSIHGISGKIDLGFQTENTLSWETVSKLMNGFSYTAYWDAQIGDSVPPRWAYE